MEAGSGRQVSSAHLAVRFGSYLKRGMGDRPISDSIRLTTIDWIRPTVRCDRAWDQTARFERALLPVALGIGCYFAPRAADAGE